MRKLFALLIFLATGTVKPGAAQLLNVRPSSGFFDAPITVVASGRVPGAEVRLSVGGEHPDMMVLRDHLVVTNTTVVRFASFQNGQRIGPIETRTYLFVSNVLQQARGTLPAFWGVNSNRPVTADYEMDPEVLATPEDRALAAKGLLSIPTLSIIVAPEDLFGAARGIYAHPEESGDEWERPCTIDWIEPHGRSTQAEAGVRIQGGWNRRPDESPKHAFRIVFRKKYGHRKLAVPLMGPDGPKEFNSLILRAGCNNSWLHWSSVERHRGEYIRDQWMRDSFREMGHPSAAGCFVHLYLNGTYWGLYNVTERPDAFFAALHFGGLPTDYDSFNADKLLGGTRDAWNELMTLLKTGVKTTAELAKIGELLDLVSFADYMLLNLYGANADWDRGSNWYAARRRSPAGKFHFFVWDAERTLEQLSDDTANFSDDESPPGIFHQLIQSQQFRQLFSERMKLHLAESGVLGPRRAAERYRHWAEILDLPMIAESARWGDYRRDVHPYKEGPYELYTRSGHWRPEVDRLLNEYFPKRAAIVAEQLAQKVW